MLYFWFSDFVLNSLSLAAFLDERLELTITGEELKVTGRGPLNNGGGGGTERELALWDASANQSLDVKGSVIKLLVDQEECCFHMAMNLAFLLLLLVYKASKISHVPYNV